MSMPVKVKSNYRSEMKNKLSETDDFEFEMNATAARLLSATLSCSSTLSPTVPSLEPTYAKSPDLTGSSEEAGRVAASNTSKTNSLSSHFAKSTIPSPATSSTRSSASSADNSYGEQTLNMLLTSSNVESASSTSLLASSSSAYLVDTTTSQKTNQQLARLKDQIESETISTDENSLNFDRGKEVPGDVAEIADEARDDGNEQLVPIFQDSDNSGVNTNGVSGDENGASDARTARTSENDNMKLVLGCVHYKRRAMFVTPCCNKFYKCRYCHDENEDHHFDRKTLTELICSECDRRQRVQETCEQCGVRFGKYTCLICNLFDDEDKAQYHCYGCGICRIGGRKNFFHCEVCNMCLPIQLKIEGHRCVENISRSNCPVCLGDIHTSRIPCHIPDCGHLLHKECFDQLLASGHYVCPTCQTSIIDMTKMWEYLDAQILIVPVPKAYENRYVNIFCNDCHKPSTAKFHFIGLKCFYCGGYNTTQEAKRRRSWVTVNDNASSA